MLYLVDICIIVMSLHILYITLLILGRDIIENNLKELIIKIKENDNKSIERLILIFEKIINKYSRKLDSEDTKQDLIIFLINIVFNMKITQQSSYTDKQIFSYISKSLKNEYIRLSKSKDKRTKLEVCFDDASLDEAIETYSNIEVLDLLNSLNSYEKYILELIFIYQFTVTDISKLLNKSRQSVNQTKVRALTKLRKNIIL